MDHGNRYIPDSTGGGELGLFDQMLKTLAANPDPESSMIDATIIRVHPQGAGAKGGSTNKQLNDRRRPHLQDSCLSGCFRQPVTL